MQANTTKQANTMQYAPQNKQQVKDLLQYIDCNKSAIAQRKSQEYMEAVRIVRESLRAYFAVNPAKLNMKKDPWIVTGARTLCCIIAEQFQVPVWDVYAEANPAVIEQ